MKKVLFVINTMGGAGAETALLELLHRLKQEEYELSLYVLTGQGELINRVPSHVRILNPHFTSSSVLSGEGRQALRKAVLSAFFKNGHFFWKVGYCLKTFTAMKKKGKVQPDKLFWRVLAQGGQRFPEQYDLAVAYLEGGSTYYVADYVNARKKASFIHIDYESSGYTKEMDQDCFDKMDQIFTVSEEVRTHFLRIYPAYREKTKIFHNIVNQEKIKEKSKLEGGFLDDFEGIRLLTVGRLTYQKAYDIAIEAMKLLKESGQNIRWYVLGEGSERAALEKKIARYGLQEDFLLLGAVENPYPWYAQTDIYVHATRFEGKSIAIQEAQTLGCPVIASNCNGNREQIVQNEDGVLCELNPEAIAAAVLDLAQNRKKRERLGTTAAKKVLTYTEELQQLTELLK